MVLFTGSYYVHEGELYRKIKPTRQGYHITNKKGERKWITMTKILEIINKK
jgi:hypothetical protein